MCTYLDEWRDEATVSWVKAHAEDGGPKTSEHEQQNKRADDDAEEAYAHPGSSLYRIECCSQFDTVWGVMIDGKVAVHKTGAIVLRHLQKRQYPRYWKTRRGAGAWAENADIEGHAAARRRARKGNPRGLSCAHYKKMNSRYPTLDTQHQRNSQYEPSNLEAETCWSRDVVDRWMEVCGGSGGEGKNGPLGREHPRHRRETHGHPPRGHQSRPETGTEARCITT